MRLVDLQAKDVVNVLDGVKIGYVVDVILVMPIGHVEAIIVEKCGIMSCLNVFRSGYELVIPWVNIVNIGADVILVNLPC